MSNTVVGGFGGDSIVGGAAGDAIFANEDSDTVNAGDGANSIVGGLGNDSIATGTGNDVVLGSEGNDYTFASLGADTLAGGSGNDAFLYGAAAEDGNGAAGGAIETVTDLNWAEDAIDTVPVTFGRNYGAAFTSQGTLTSAADAAVSTAFVEAGGGTVAAQFVFGGRTFLTVDLDDDGSFLDANDLLIDITGVTGTTSTARFV